MLLKPQAINGSLRFSSVDGSIHQKLLSRLMEIDMSYTINGIQYEVCFEDFYGQDWHIVDERTGIFLQEKLRERVKSND